MYFGITKNTGNEGRKQKYLTKMKKKSIKGVK